MKNYASKALLTVCVILLSGPLMKAQRPSSGPMSIPPSTPIIVRINENLSSESAKAGDTFTGTLAQPLVVNGKTVFAKGVTVTGRVVLARKSGRLSDPGVLELTLASIGSGWHSASVSSQPFVIKGASHTKSNVVKIGGGTAAGAIIGGIVGGGKGAAIGAGVGAGAGTATAAATGKKPATVESEAVLEFLSGDPAQEDPVLRSSTREYGNDEHSYREYKADRGHSRHDDDGDDDDDNDDRPSPSMRDYGYSFGERDREVLRGCLSGYDFEGLPPGIQKKLARGGTLPPGQAKKLRALPGSCTGRLPRLPRGVDRIIFGDRVILLEGGSRILDIFIFVR